MKLIAKNLIQVVHPHTFLMETELHGFAGNGERPVPAPQ
jgi:hypothetical protein